LTAEGDAETGALTPVAVPVACAWEEELDEAGLAAAADRLQGKATRGWTGVAAALVDAGLIRPHVPDRGAP
jgi:hypothetical protein